jgi:putative acetyltransferase
MEEPVPEVAVRAAEDDDLDGIVEMVVAVAAEGRWIAAEAPVDTGRRRRYLAEALDDEHALVLVADAGGSVVGELGMTLAGYGVADLGMLVADDWRGRGIGTALLEAGLDWARQAGAHKVALQVWPHNQAAIGLYEKFGFQREGLLRRHYRRRSGELWDAVVMGLFLDPPDQPVARPGPPLPDPGPHDRA